MRTTKSKPRKKDGRKPRKIEKEKNQDLQGNGIKKRPPDSPLKLTQQQPDP